jgi:O-acetyl-ADP-ribose deacetylase (regulator of RNase III)
MIEVIEDDLLNATEDYIAHQCNCVTDKASFLAAQIFKNYPYADTYKSRTIKTRNVPGTIDIIGNGGTERYVINMYCQFYPSIAKYKNDSQMLRKQWFQKCLDKIADVLTKNPGKTLAMPYKIGCGSAGGDWTEYYDILDNFATTNNIEIKLYKYEK